MRMRRDEIVDDNMILFDEVGIREEEALGRDVN